MFLDKAGNVLYVGKAKNLKNRVSSYFQDTAALLDKTQSMIAQVAKIKTTVVENELESLLLEANFIKKYDPKYNSRLTDGKSYPLIRITIKDDFPAVVIARRIEDKNSVYFGPYPSAGSMKMVLRLIRRIFPYQSVSNHPKRICLYHHLGLCPCPPVFDTKDFRKDYRKTIHHIVQFLEGKAKSIKGDLEKEREAYSRQEDFETAAKVQKQIDAIDWVTSPKHTPFEYEVNPNLRSDLINQAQDELLTVLQKHNVPVTNLERIECYDMSNIQGFKAVGSMVVFTDGEKDTIAYRRFKIRSLPDGMPNDFASMQEVLKRRFNHDEWPYPSLLIVDGGKGQVSAAQKVLSDQNIQVPLIGLAKREETIITSDFTEILLPKDSPALHLMQRIRNEAHRFAITYHRKLRSKIIVD